MGAIRELYALASSKTFNPLELSPAIWYAPSDRIDDGGGYTQQYLDLSGNGRHSNVQTGTSKPLHVASDVNGLPCDVYDGVDDFINSPNFSLTQPFTVFLVAKQLSTSADKAFLGATSGVLALYVQGGFYKMYAGSVSPLPLLEAGEAELNAVHILNATFNGSSSDLINQNTSVKGTIGTTNPVGLCLGRYAQSNTQCLNMKFYELIVYNGVVSETNRLKVIRYLKNKYATSWDTLNELYDGVLHNSFTQSDQNTFKIKNPLSEYRFTYSGTELKIAANPRAYTQPALQIYATITIICDGVEILTQQVVSKKYFNVTLPIGSNKSIKIIEGITSLPTSEVLGTWLMSIKGDKSQFAKTPIDTVAEKIVVLGDSITVGDHATKPALEGYAPLFRVIDNKEVAIMGWGYAKMFDFAETTPKITDTINKIQSLFSNVVGVKKLLIALGTNDYGLSSTSAATFISWYSALLDAIHIADSSIIVYCLSPLYRNGQTQLLLDYNSSISTMCSTRTPWVTYIDGQPILSYPGDYAGDGLHPITAGHLKLKNAVGNYIL